MSRVRILSVGCNHHSLAARHRLLEREGFEVTSVLTTFGALDLLQHHEFSAAVIGHEFSFTEKQLFAADVGERWRIPVVVLYAGADDLDLPGDDSVDSASDTALIKSLHSVTAVRRSA